MHCCFSPTTIALAAVKWAFDVGNITWHAYLKSDDGCKKEKMQVWEHYRRKAIDATASLENVPLENVIGSPPLPPSSGCVACQLQQAVSCIAAACAACG